MRHQKSALFGSEIRMERSHSTFCTNRYKIDIKQHFGEIKNEVFFKERRLLRLKGPVG